MIAVSIDGVIVAPEHASVSVFDRGLLYGDGCFEVLRTWNGAAGDLEAHLDRLFDTAQFLSLKTVERSTLTGAVHRTIAAAGNGEQRIRIVLTRGAGSLAQHPGDLGPGRAIVIVEPLPSQPNELSLAVVDWPVPQRNARGHKTLAYLDAILARELARAAGADEALRLDTAGNIVEGATCNLFVVHAGTVVTPPVDRGALPGIVRARVLELCARDGIAAQVRDLSVGELRGAHEAFVTSSLRGVVPVTRIDAAALPRGPVTQRLAQRYASAMCSTS